MIRDYFAIPTHIHSFLVFFKWNIPITNEETHLKIVGLLDEIHSERMLFQNLYICPRFYFYEI